MRYIGASIIVAAAFAATTLTTVASAHYGGQMITVTQAEDLFMQSPITGDNDIEDVTCSAINIGPPLTAKSKIVLTSKHFNCSAEVTVISDGFYKSEGTPQLCYFRTLVHVLKDGSIIISGMQKQPVCPN